MADDDADMDGVVEDEHGMRYKIDPIKPAGEGDSIFSDEPIQLPEGIEKGMLPSEMTPEQLAKLGLADLKEPLPGDAMHPGELEMRVGRITAITNHPNIDSLAIEMIELGKFGDDRVLSTEIIYQPHYSRLNDCVDQKVVVICNINPLEPRGIGGTKGSLLMATKENDYPTEEFSGNLLEMIQAPPESEPGARVYVPTYPIAPFPTKDEEVFEFLVRGFRVNEEGHVFFKDQPLLVEGCGETPCFTTSLFDCDVRMD